MAANDRTLSRSAQRRDTLVVNADDGTSELDGSIDCLGIGLTLTGNAIDVGNYRSFEIYAQVSDIGNPLQVDYQTSPDNLEWFNGEISISNMDNNKQIITPTETAIKYLRLRVTVNGNGSAVDPLLCIVCKS